MLTIPNRELHLMQLLAKKLMNTRRRRTGLTLVVRPGDGQTLLEVARHGTGLQRTLAVSTHGDTPAFEPFTISLDDLAEPIQAKPCAVRFEQGDDSLTISWTDHGVPRQLVRPLIRPESDSSIPNRPQPMTVLDQEFAEAFAAAASVTSKHSIRYALHCVCLDGRRGRIAGTDGVQAYTHGGFELPWQTSVLIPATLPLGHAAVRSRHVEIGAVTGERESDSPAPIRQVIVRSGDWTFWVPTESGTFPDMDRVIPYDPAPTRLALDRSDALKLIEQLDGLPGEKDSPVTVRCNDLVTVRSEADGETAELRLVHSRTLGFPAPVYMRRSFLKRAASLGFEELRFHGDGRPACCRDDQRSYVWMTLDTPPEAKSTAAGPAARSAPAPAAA